MRPSIRHAPRGHRWTWAGLRFLALGDDRAYRVLGVSWWPEEASEAADVARCLEGGPVDVMICHEAPAGLDYRRPEDVNRAVVAVDSGRTRP